MTIHSCWDVIIPLIRNFMRNTMIPIVTFLAPSFWLNWPSIVIHKPKFDHLGSLGLRHGPTNHVMIELNDMIALGSNSGNKSVWMNKPSLSLSTKDKCWTYMYTRILYIYIYIYLMFKVVYFEYILEEFSIPCHNCRIHAWIYYRVYNLWSFFWGLETCIYKLLRGPACMWPPELHLQWPGFACVGLEKQCVTY